MLDGCPTGSRRPSRSVAVRRPPHSARRAFTAGRPVARCGLQNSSARSEIRSSGLGMTGELVALPIVTLFQCPPRRAPRAARAPPEPRSRFAGMLSGHDEWKTYSSGKVWIFLLLSRTVNNFAGRGSRREPLRSSTVFYGSRSQQESRPSQTNTSSTRRGPRACGKSGTRFRWSSRGSWRTTWRKHLNKVTIGKATSSPGHSKPA